MIMVIIVICLLMEKKSTRLNVIIKNVNFPTQFCLGSISNKSGAVDYREDSVKGNVYDFQVITMLLTNQIHFQHW